MNRAFGALTNLIRMLPGAPLRAPPQAGMSSAFGALFRPPSAFGPLLTSQSLERVGLWVSEQSAQVKSWTTGFGLLSAFVTDNPTLPVWLVHIPLVPLLRLHLAYKFHRLLLAFVSCSLNDAVQSCVHVSGHARGIATDI